MIARILAALPALLAATALAGARPACAEADAGSAKWAADQFKQIGLKAAPNAHGYLASVRIKGAAGRAEQVVGVLPGTDPLLGRDYVVVSARLDPAGEAALFAAARALAASPVPVRRSIVFVLSAVDGADRPAAVPSERVIADLSLDVVRQAAEGGLLLTAADETSLGRDAGEAAAAAGLPVVRVAADTETYGVRSQGVPTLAIGVDAAKAGQAGAWLAALVAQVAQREERPAWSPGSRFAPPAPRAEQVLTTPVYLPQSRHPQRATEANG